MKTKQRFRLLILVLTLAVMAVAAGCAADKKSEAKESTEEVKNEVKGSGEDAKTQLRPTYPVSVTYVAGGINADEETQVDTEILRKYSFDDHGHPVSCAKTDQGAEIEDTYGNDYRDDGSLERVAAHNGYYDADAGTVYEDVIREYDDQGRLTLYDWNGMAEKYEYDEDGLLVRMESIVDGNEADKTVYEYSYEGVNDKDLSKTASVKYIVYEDSQISEETEERIITYNSDGFMTKEEFLIPDGIPEWEYDYEIEDGRVTKVTQHYEDSEFYIYSFEYDDDQEPKMTEKEYVQYINGIFGNSLK